MGEEKKKKYTFKKGKKKILLIALVIIVVIGASLLMGDRTPFNVKDDNQKMYISSSEKIALLYDSELKFSREIIRGTEIESLGRSITGADNETYIKIRFENDIYFINKINIVEKEENIILEQKIYVRTPATIYEEIDNGKISGLADKGIELEVLGFDKINEDGSVNAYEVAYNGQSGYIYGKYTLLDEADAQLHYEPEKYYDIHYNRGDRYGGGHAGNLDYFPYPKKKFEDNVMPEKVYALYLNSGKNVIGNVDAYIEFAKPTKINAFVIDIKDNESPGYKSTVYEKFSATNYKYANNSFENYKSAIEKIKTAGFYTIGRITVFKDKYFVIDRPDIAILDSRNNEPYLHSNTYWPSPYQRDVWEFNVSLAKEAAVEMGFNEIQFDYVRFPDRTIDAEKKGLMLFGNEYNEDKAQAIQRFLMYACDELHKINTYVSADVFGESAYNYVTAYGQYWPAISNVVDVISGMPYPDHFNRNDFGFKVPVWTIPYELLNLWGGSYVMKRQQEIPTPAPMRTWIQVYDVPNYKHAGGFSYNDEQIEAQIRGLFDAGLTGGYMTWLSHSSLERYKRQANVYSKEY